MAGALFSDTETFAFRSRVNSSSRP